MKLQTQYTKFLLVFTLLILGITQDLNLQASVKVTADTTDITVEYGAQNVQISISAVGQFRDIQDSCLVGVYFIALHMPFCMKQSKAFVTGSLKFYSITKCIIPGPLVQTQYLNISGSASCSNGLHSQATKNFTITVKEKPPSQNLQHNLNLSQSTQNESLSHLGLLIGVSILGGIILTLIGCACYIHSKKNGKNENKNQATNQLLYS